MGWSGALAGLGKGMQDYSNILGEQKKQDWLIQRDLAMHERNKELEFLRNNNENLRLDKSIGANRQNMLDNQGFLTTQSEIAAKQAEALANKQSSTQIAIHNSDNAAAMQRIGAQSAAQIAAYKQMSIIDLGKELQKGQINLEQMSAVADKAFELDNKKKEATYNKLSSMLSPTATEKDKSDLQMAVYAPELLTLIKGSDKIESDQKIKIMEETSKAYLEAAKEYSMLPSDVRDTWDKKAKKVGEPSGQIAYAHMVASNVPSASGLFGNTKQQPGAVSYKWDSDVAAKLRSDLSSGATSLSDATNKLGGTVYQSILDDYSKNRKTQQNTSTNTPGAFSTATKSFVDFASRNSPGGQQDKLKELQRQYPGMSDQFYQIKLKEM